MTVGEKIKQIRESKDMSQGDLAKLMNVSRQAISKAELHEGYLTTEKIKKFADALGVTPAILMGWDEEPISMETDEERHQELLAKYVESVYLANEMSSYIDKLKELPPSLRQVVYTTIDGLYNAKEEQ